MKTTDLFANPHRRFNPLTGEWILVSPHRTKRPWQGKKEESKEKDKKHDPDNYLAPGNVRANGERNPDYQDVYSFTNDFGAMLPDIPDNYFEKGGLLRAKSEKGICRVICFSPNADLTLPEMETEAIRKVIDLWQNEFTHLSRHDFINYIQIFENKGAIMGCSNPHPHGQIWAQNSVPTIPAKIGKNLEEYYREHGTSLLLDYIALEKQEKERILIENEDFIALVPFWATWPYETMLISKRHIQDITQIMDKEKDSFADILKKLTTLYDNLFEISFPYSAGMHQAPTDGKAHPGWHFYMHFLPPLLRSADVKKFMVGYEMLSEPQRDITPEYSANLLRSLSDVHYKLRK